MTISDYKNSVDTPVTYSVDTGKKAAIAYTRSNGRIGLFTVNGGALASDKLDVANNLKAVITVSRGSRSYDVTVWYSTGKRKIFLIYHRVTVLFQTFTLLRRREQYHGQK